MTDSDGADNASDTGSSDTGSSAPVDDPKEQMRIALEKKKQNTQSRASHLDGHAKASGEHGKAGGGRQFRRKSGG